MSKVLNITFIITGKIGRPKGRKSKGGRPKKERPEVEIEGVRLFSFMKVLENKRFECQICKCSCETRHNLFTHINR